MPDKFSNDVRSRVMSRIRSRDTKPEKLVRSMIHSLGYRFRLHDKKLPGKPDLVLKKHQTAVFVNGCFWHQHPGCKKAVSPKSNNAYWDPKLAKNVERDKKNIEAIENEGLRCLILWECETNDLEALRNKIKVFMDR